MEKPELKKLIAACIKLAKEAVAEDTGTNFDRAGAVPKIASVLLEQTLCGNINREIMLKD